MFCLKVCLLLWAVCQTDTSTRHITDRYREINAHTGSYRQVVIESEQQSTEGGEVTGYFSGDSIVLIVENVFGEMGKTRAEIYYDRGAPVFIYSRDYHYRIPMYSSTFSNKDVTVEEDRAYFKNDKMIKWINKKKVPLIKRDQSFITYEQHLLEYAQQLYTRLQKARLNPS